MHRREFLSTSLGVPLLVSGLGAAPDDRASVVPSPSGGAPRPDSPVTPIATQEKPVTPSATTAPLFYLWRQYTLRNGPQQARMAAFMKDALVPALNRLGCQPVGVFEALIGPTAPATYLLVPHASAETLLALDARLAADADFVRTADPYLKSTALDPAYLRIETWLLKAFPNVPAIEVPAAAAAKGPRMFELRMYESPSELTHRAKRDMFITMGELEIFRKTGLTPVFFADMLVGPRMPNFVYMLTHENLAAREEHWKTFVTSPEWKKVSATPGYSDAEIVSNISTTFLRPAAASQL